MSRRGERIRPYPKEYYRGEDWLTLDQLPVQLCEKLEAEVAGKSSRRRRDGEWQDFPWLSLVIGTGCLEVPGASAGVAAAMADAVSRQLHELTGLRDLRLYDGLVASFTRSLATDRLMATRQAAQPEGAPDPDGVKVSTEAGELTLAAALLTSLYHQMSTATPHAMSRWENDVAELDVLSGSTESARLEPLVQTTLEVLQSVRKRLRQRRTRDFDPRSRDTEAQVLDAVGALLHETWVQLSSDEQSRSVSVQRVRLLTEVAWYFLIRKTAIYPGWTDLLLRLMLSQRTRSAGRSPRRPRPRYQDLVELTAAAEAILDQPTQDSWVKTQEWFSSSERTFDKHARQRLYHAVAEVLWAQADARRGPGPEARLLPSAVVFTTTLDLELEMALRATRPGERFRVAVPTYVIDDVKLGEAHFCWLLGDVQETPPHADDLGSLRWLRDVQDWRVLDEQSFAKEQEHSPVVVHLSGTPLLTPPEQGVIPPRLRDQLVADGIDVSEKTFLVPAITVDEYLAMRQSESELAWLARDDKDAHARKRRGLPEGFTAPESSAGTVRFWMVMGVPMADPAVRNRVLSQLAAVHRLSVGKAPVERLSEGFAGKLGLPPARLGAAPATARHEAEPAGQHSDEAPPPGPSEIHGAAVTLHIDDDEVALLHWLGLDVVEDSCHGYAEDLQDYAGHVRASAQGRRGTGCSLMGRRG